MEKIRALIVDDEPLARERIRSLVEGEPDLLVLGECADGQAAIIAINEQQPDLVFLDVQMPEVDGFGVLEALAGAHLPVIIFVTAYDQYALRAFDVHALDYLLKPFDRERFRKALARARTQLQGERSGEIDRRLLALLKEIRPEPKALERLVIKSAGRVVFLKCEEIDWIEAAGNYARLHTGRESHLLRETMNALEARLDPNKFLRIHRSTIINIERIKELHPLFRGEHVIILQDGTRLTLGRGYRDKLHELLGNSL